MASEVVAVLHDADVYAAKLVARNLAARIGFDSGTVEEIVLVVTELATNLMRHAGGGNLIFTAISANNRNGIQIESLDEGPGIESIEKSFADGYSTAAGPGYGLGTVNRLMDEVDLFPADRGGVHLTCRRWIRPLNSASNAFAIGVATCSHPRMPVNGDSFVVKQWQRRALVAVIDGLGHGPEAHHAAETARHYVENHFDSSLSSIFLGVARTCVSTRGVVMAVACFDADENKLTFASLGNIEARLFGSSKSPTLPVSRGILGHTNKMPVVSEYNWDHDSVLVLHSDGLTARWHWNDFDFSDQSPAAIAQELLQRLARREDDATVAVVKRAY